MVAAFLAGVGPPLGHGMKLSFNRAARAIKTGTPKPAEHDRSQTSRIIGILGLKLPKGGPHD